LLSAAYQSVLERSDRVSSVFKHVGLSALISLISVISGKEVDFACLSAEAGNSTYNSISYSNLTRRINKHHDSQKSSFYTRPDPASSLGAIGHGGSHYASPNRRVSWSLQQGFSRP
jgi:hypothetical protein